MAFNDIFDYARNASTMGTGTEKTVSGYIPKQPNESVTVPPHDPFKPVPTTQQDPKIIRETSPQAFAMFNFVEGITSAVFASSDSVEASTNEPKTVVTPASSVMHPAHDISRKVTDNVPDPSNQDKHVTPANLDDIKMEKPVADKPVVASQNS